MRLTPDCFLVADPHRQLHPYPLFWRYADSFRASGNYGAVKMLAGDIAELKVREEGQKHEERKARHSDEMIIFMRLC